MKKKIKLLVLFAFLGITAFAQPKPYVEIEITPSEEKSGSIVVNISNLHSTDYNRLVLLPLPIELTPNLPVGTSYKFNAYWYIDSEDNKTQLWLGNILPNGQTTLKMSMNLPKMMANSENTANSYKLKINPNYSDGLHKFLSLTDKDSTNIVFADKVVFNGNEKYKVVDTHPGNQWEKTEDENVWEYTISPQNENKHAYLIFSIPSVTDTVKFLGAIILAFIVSLLAGLGLYKFPKETQKKVAAAIGFVVVCSTIFVVILTLFKDLEFDMKTVFEVAAPVVGYSIGILIGFGTNNKQNIENAQ